MSAVIKGGIIGGIILFIWSAISWMALPWHEKTIQGFKDETAMSQIITANATESGVYMLPSVKDNAKSNMQGPMIFAAVTLTGMKSMVTPMVTQFIIQLIAAFLVTWMLTKTAGLGYGGRVLFVLIFALAASVVTNLPYWNWFGFSTNYTLVTIADTLIGWFLAALVIAKIVHPREAASRTNVESPIT